MGTPANIGIRRRTAREWLRHPSHAGYGLHSLPLRGIGSKPRPPLQPSAWNRVVRVEDPLADGGFGAWLREALALHPDIRTRLTNKAPDPKPCDVVAGQAALHARGGLVP